MRYCSTSPLSQRSDFPLCLRWLSRTLFLSVSLPWVVIGLLITLNIGGFSLSGCVAYGCQYSLMLQISPVPLFAPRGQPAHMRWPVGSLITMEAFATCRFILKKRWSFVLSQNDWYISNAFFFSNKSVSFLIKVGAVSLVMMLNLYLCHISDAYKITKTTIPS